MKQESRTMEALIEKYTRDLRSGCTNKPAPAEEDQTIIITGTTGALGSYMIDFASSNPKVQKIICLNCSENAKERQSKGNEERGLSTDLSKAEFLHANLSQFDLGLGKNVYGRLLGEVDRVIHNQWPVNFNMPVESFEPHIRGVRNPADFSRKAAKRVPIIFVSSIATTEGWNQPGPVPERFIHDFSLAVGGYGRSKLVSSLILEKAAEISKAPTEIVRVGQIGGPVSEKGFWNRQEWLPSLIASSLYLRLLPDGLGPMTSTADWTPVEGTANLVLEVSGVADEVAIDDMQGYFHGVNPAKTQWQALAPAVKDQAKTEDISKNPGIKLLDTYKAWSQAAKEGQKHILFDMTRTKERSKTMREMKAVTPELVKNCCRQWEF
ncbi:ochratoxin A non-ribosomal peptide synthetase [Lasiosphaeria ovina]|uniref:Ochratoxin A non-ribosomal peptide synthetase n=1 Tax=Lasiosphaeria ovina TaxID=92902 RepID=A0AAE0JUK8_9PEZI|nr:ochratoxin A non-ribosomal peptide synthetase [Lasiosphaeria ovina]